MKNLRTLLIAALFFNSIILLAQTPPSFFKSYITEAVGDGCHNVSDCAGGLICFDVSVEIDEPGWHLDAYDIWVDYGADSSIFSYASDASCYHVDGGDINLNQFGKYRFLAAQAQFPLEANTPTIIHNFCLKVIDFNNFDTTSITTGGIALNSLNSNYSLVVPGTQTATVGFILPSNPYFVDQRQLHSISDTIVFNSCLTADISITESDFIAPAYSWSTGDTNSYISGIGFGRYFVTITDSIETCRSVVSYFVDFPAACQSQVIGQVHIQDSNICSTNAEQFLARNQKVQILPVELIVPTNQNGYFEVNLPPGIYEFNPVLDNNQFIACPDTLFLQIDTANSNIDTLLFDLLDTTFCEIEMAVASGRVRAGRDVLIKSIITNKGNQDLQNVVVAGIFDEAYDFDMISSIYPIDSINDTSHTVYWSINTLAPGEAIEIGIIMQPFRTTPRGTVLENFFSTNIDCDEPFQFDQTVTGAYDPNDKTLNNSIGRDNTNILKSDSILDYTIRFQNTGNDTAFSVVITDELSEFLDIYSFEPGPASHDYTWRILPNRLVEFTFDPILLPYQSIDDDGSQGFVSFSIKRNNDVELGDIIHNNAHIIFDFNEAIVTNTVISEYVRPVYLLELNYTLCDGDSIYISSQYYYSATIFNDTISYFDFDTIFTHQILSGSYDTTLIMKSVPVGTVVFDKVVNQDTVFIFHYLSQAPMCDSVVIYQIQVISSIDDIANESISVFPNPFNQSIHIITESQIQTIQLFDFKGQEQLHLNNVNKIYIDISSTNIPAGLYMVHVKTMDRHYVRKLVKLE